MFGLTIDRKQPTPITIQLTQQLREAILWGKIEAGQKMPPTRQLAKELGISRNSTVQVYEQLLAEGYLNSTVGSGTYAADIGVLSQYPNKRFDCHSVLLDTKPHSDVIVFDAGNPDVSAFPRALWGKMLKEACLDAESDAFGYGVPGGHPLLKTALSDYLYRAKGIYCEKERIFIVPGISAGIELVSRLLYNNDASAIVEDPCLMFARQAIEKSGLQVLPVESDTSGICVNMLPDIKDLRLIYVASSHQYPLGGVLPASRRIALLKFAQKHDAYVIEDDYDSEFRYHGEPIQSLWHLDSDRVVHLGSLSNVFSPSLRIAYMILPPCLVRPAYELMTTLNIWISSIKQIAVSRLLDTKELDRHIYRMKKRYDAKRKHLINCLITCFGSSVTISGDDAGLHLMITLERDLTKDDFKAFEKNGVEADFVEDYALIKGKHENQLVLGFGNLSMEKIEEGVKRLHRSLMY